MLADPCGICGTTTSADGDWYRVCGPCRWRDALNEPEVIRQFVSRVNARAEADIRRGCNPIKGAHFRALEAELAVITEVKERDQ